jgi:hypothetical protein
MYIRQPSLLLRSLGAAALLASSAAFAQTPSAMNTTGADSTGNTQSEREACMHGATQQDRATCLLEARNAAYDKRRGLLNANNQGFEANQLARCQVLPSAEDKAACEARIRGQGTVSGSVAGGGVLRQVETVTTVMPAESTPARRSSMNAPASMAMPQR